MADTDKNTAVPTEAEEQPQPTEQPEEITASTEPSAEQDNAEATEAEEQLEGETVSPLDLRPGMTVRVYQKIKEGSKERVQMFQGMIIAMRGSTPHTRTITVQKKSLGVWVDKIFPLTSPLIEKIEVVKIARVRRAKLHYIPTHKRKLKETLVQQG